MDFTVIAVTLMMLVMLRRGRMVRNRIGNFGEVTKQKWDEESCGTIMLMGKNLRDSYTG